MPAPVEKVRAVRLLADLPAATLQRIADVADEVDVRAGQMLIEADDPGAGVFLLCEGRVEVQTRSGRREVAAGAILGELALLRRDGLRSARVQALTPLQCLAVPRTQFRALLEQEPPLALALLEHLADRVADD